MPGPNAAKDEVREALGQLAKEELMQANPSRELRLWLRTEPNRYFRRGFSWIGRHYPNPFCASIDLRDGANQSASQAGSAARP